MYKDASGFSVPVPKAWRVQPRGSEVYFYDDTRAGRILIVDQTRTPQWNPVADWEGKEADRRGSYNNYQKIKIAPVKFWKKAADWEFTRTSDRGNALHVLKRGFITANDQAYGITWSTSEANWDADQANLNLIFKGFKPARAD
jgi:hypothetical protein